eukprot:3653596-Rhodomonas_salina.2
MSLSCKGTSELKFELELAVAAAAGSGPRPSAKCTGSHTVVPQAVTPDNSNSNTIKPDRSERPSDDQRRAVTPGT